MTSLSVSETAGVHEATVDPQLVDEQSVLGLVELLLKQPEHVDQLLHEPARQVELIPRLLTIGLVGFTIYGVTATTLLNLAPAWPAYVPAARIGTASVANLSLAYALGMIAANGICLPSFYFYSLLAGVRTTMLSVAAHALRGIAVGALALVGLLPWYFAAVLGCIVLRMPNATLHWWLYAGLVLPFIAGLWGVRSLYRGFLTLCDVLPPNRRGRACFARRLLLSWCGCFTAITPLLIYSLWHYLSL